MWKKTERAFDIMRERNRRYLEEKKKEEAEKGEQGDEPSDVSEEQRIGAEKLRAYREANSLDPDAKIPEELPGEPEDLSPEEAERRAEEYRKRNKEGVKLEKGDLPAMIIAAFLVFGPVFLVLFGILFLAWFFLH